MISKRISLLVKITVTAISISVMCCQALAQYAVDWPKQPPTPLATDVPPGSQTLRISNVNDFLYTYTVNIVEKGTPLQFTPAPAGPAEGCTATEIVTYASDVATAYAAYQKLFPDS